MRAFMDIFSSDAGLMSLAVIVVMLGMGGYYISYFIRHVREDSAREDAAKR
jgi:Protein of unknown function (DUF3149)